MRHHLYPPGINPGEAEYQISPQPRRQKPYTPQASRNPMQKETETTQQISVGEFPSVGPFPPTNTTTPDNDNAIEVDVVADRIDTADNTQITSLVERMDKATTSAESRKKSLFFIADSHGKVDNNCTLQHYVAQLPVDIKMYEAIGGGCYHSLRQYIEQALDEARKDDVLCCYMGSNDIRDCATNRRGPNTTEQVLEELNSLLQKITEVARKKQIHVLFFHPPLGLKIPHRGI